MENSGCSALLQHVCDGMPIRTRVLGRHKIEELLLDVVYRWPVDELSRCMGDGDQQQRVLDRLRDRVGRQRLPRGEKRYGSVLLLFALSTIISLAFQWWLHRRNKPESAFMGQGRER